MNQEHLAIASVPVQNLNTTLSQEQALVTGTVFPELNKPFFVTEEMTEAIQESEPKQQGKPKEAVEREEMMKKIQEVSFFVDDMRLFMDTHPENQNGLELLKNAVKDRKELLKKFAFQFYPLTMDCMADIYQENPASECYCWKEGPMPWEGACV